MLSVVDLLCVNMEFKNIIVMTVKGRVYVYIASVDISVENVISHNSDPE